MTPEGKVKEKVKRLLKKHNVYYFMPVQTGMGATTLDFLGCVGGVFFAIETKADEKGKLSKLQEVTAREIKKAGGDVFVIKGVDSSVFLTLEVFLCAYETEPPQEGHMVTI